MTIACLGWGSLIWNPGDLPLYKEWRTDGPALPVEFARQSNNGRITLVITDDAVTLRVLWAELDVQSLEEARRVLAVREGIQPAHLQNSVGAWTPHYSSRNSNDESIGRWAEATRISGVVWTALKPYFSGEYSKPSCDQVVQYLGDLQGERRRVAEEYVRRTPVQIRTPYRERIERELGWAPLSANEAGGL